MDIPLYSSKVAAGFPSPADDYLEQRIDLNAYLVPHPQATFYVKVEGDSMIRAGIFPGDLLVIDRSQEAHPDSVILAVLNGAFTVKRLKKIQERTFLYPENPKYSPIEITAETEFAVWGVVLHVIHSFR